MSDGDEDQMQLLQRLREDASPFDECAEDGQQTGTVKEDGMNIWQTSISIGGYLAGFAFLAIEVFVVSAGWSGFIIFAILYLMLAITTILLGRCWNFVRHKWGTERHPYGAIGYEAFGDYTRSFINFLVASISLCGSISLQLAFAETALIIGGPAVRGTFCIWPIVYGVFMCPFMWLGTPKDFWWISASSYFTVVLSIPLIIFSLVTQGGLSPSEVTHQQLQEGPVRESAMYHVAEMTGLLLWTRGFHYSFPTVQQDMKQPQSFTKAALLTDMLVLPLVLPMLLILYIIYGDTLAAITGDVTVLNLLHEDALKRVAGCLIMVHIVGACVLSNNPLFQYLEEVFDVPTNFTWKRAALRSTVVFFEVFIDETIPHITIFASIACGVLMPVLCIALPPMCYLRLRNTKAKPVQGTLDVPSDDSKSMIETVVCFFLIAATPFLMAFVLYSTGTSIAWGRTVFTVPCYVNATLAHA